MLSSLRELLSLQTLDDELLDASVTQHSSGIYALAQTDDIEDAERVQASQMGELLTFLRQHYDHVVIDGVRGFGDLALEALDSSDNIFVTLTQDVPAVRNTQRALNIFQRLNFKSI